MLPISVKGSQDGGWMLAVKYVKPGVNYIEAANAWLASQRRDVVFVFVQFLDVSLGEAPRCYVARPNDISDHLKTQRNGNGHGALHENYNLRRPKSKYDHRIPDTWHFSEVRIDSI
jgi:hypothetical protein